MILAFKGVDQMTAALAFREKTSSAEDSSLVVRRYPNDVLLFVVKGHLHKSIVKGMIEHTRALTSKGERFAVFHDWSEVTSYDSWARLELTRLMLTGHGDFICTHILTSSREVRFGVEVANIVLGYKIDEHTDRATFDRAMQKRLALRVVTRA